MSDLSFFEGRKLLKSEIPVEKRYLRKDKRIIRYPTMTTEGRLVRCLRCNSRHVKQLVQIETNSERYYYCPTCIQLGRVQSNQTFYGCLARSSLARRALTLDWHGTLSSNQAVASQKIETTISHNQRILIDAVTGAGKTEMLFAGLCQAMQQGKRVCLASPRTDVCLEVFPRFSQVFPAISISLLYGKQTADYHYSPFVICTTHQLLRFYQAFDVLVIDEVDAFPYVNNQLLAHGVKQAVRKTSSVLYLSATPTKELQQQAKKAQINYHQVPVRYHGHPLPVPKGVWVRRWADQIKQHRLPLKIAKILAHQLTTKRRTLLFCPTIKLVEDLGQILQQAFPTKRIAAVHASDVARYDKVSEMRDKSYDLLLTTTILERGVTFEAIDVMVIGSNHEVFNEEALIQIAGRVGRSGRDPIGAVWLIHDGWSRAMKSCCQIIRQTNQRANKKGLLTR